MNLFGGEKNTNTQPAPETAPTLSPAELPVPEAVNSTETEGPLAGPKVVKLAITSETPAELSKMEDALASATEAPPTVDVSPNEDTQNLGEGVQYTDPDEQEPAISEPQNPASVREFPQTEPAKQPEQAFEPAPVAQAPFMPFVVANASENPAPESHEEGVAESDSDAPATSGFEKMEEISPETPAEPESERNAGSPELTASKGDEIPEPVGQETPVPDLKSAEATDFETSPEAPIDVDSILGEIEAKNSERDAFNAEKDAELKDLKEKAIALLDAELQRLYQNLLDAKVERKDLLHQSQSKITTLEGNIKTLETSKYELAKELKMPLSEAKKSSSPAGVKHNPHNQTEKKAA